jgi:hypothetical protein
MGTITTKDGTQIYYGQKPQRHRDTKAGRPALPLCLCVFVSLWFLT